MRHLLLSLVVFFATSIIAADAPTKRVRLNEFYTVIPMATSPQMDVANWMVANQQQGNPSADSADQLLANFKSQAVKDLKNGIFVYSITHSVELTDKEKAKAAPRQLELLNDKVWREAENKLVSELVTAANTEGIPVWALLRGTGELHTYKLLTDPKLTLKK
ncbi:MAG TPA: hypothetical protein DDZ88_02350 [Verrucomicrobiales bacterium]|nr:hypothetical protein [Verrucomicrobiales bacterium]